MRRFQLSFPTLLFAMSFALCMVVALLFIKRQSGDDAFDTAGTRSPGSLITPDGETLTGKALASLPSDALPREPAAYSSVGSANGTAASSTSTPFPSPTDNLPPGQWNILDQAVEARNARAASLASPGQTELAYVPASSPDAYPAASGSATATPALPGSSPTPNPFQGMSPEQVARMMHGKITPPSSSTPYSTAQVPQGPAARSPIPTITIPEQFAPRYNAPTPTPPPTPTPFPRTTTRLPYQTNFPNDQNSLTYLSSQYGMVPTPAYGTAQSFSFPTNAYRPNQGLLPPPGGQTGTPSLPPDQTLFPPGLEAATLTPSVLPDDPASILLNTPLSPIPSLSDTEPVELPLETPLAPPDESPLPTSTPVADNTPAPSPAIDPVKLASARLTPPQREGFSVSKEGASVTFDNVSTSYARPDASQGGKTDVQNALKAIQEAAAKASPAGGTSSPLPAVPTAVPPAIRSDTPIGTGPIDYARLGQEGASPSPTSSGKKEEDARPLPAELAARTRQGAEEPEIYARVGDRVLTRREAHRRVDAMLALQGKTADEDRRITLARLAAEEWAEKAALVEMARSQGITVSEQEVREFTERTRQRFTGTNIEDALRSAGFTDDEIRAEMRESALCEKLIEQQVARKYDEAKLRAVYEASPEQFQPGRRLRVYEIVKAKPKDKEAERDVKRQLEALQRQISSGGRDFMKAASEMSDAPSRTNGGDLGWIDDRSASRITPSMARALESLRPGEISGVVEGADHFAIYKLAEVKEPEPGFAGARERVIESLEALERKEAFEEARKSLVVSITHQEQKSKGATITPPGQTPAPRSPRSSAVASAPSSSGRNERSERSSRESGRVSKDLEEAVAQRTSQADAARQLEELTHVIHQQQESERRNPLSRLLGGLRRGHGQEEEQPPAEPLSATETQPAARSQARAEARRSPQPAATPAASEPQAPPGFGGATTGVAPPDNEQRGGVRGFLSRFRR